MRTVVLVTLSLFLESLTHDVIGAREWENSLNARMFYPIVMELGFPRVFPAHTTILQMANSGQPARIIENRSNLTRALESIQSLKLRPSAIVIDASLQDLRASDEALPDTITQGLVRVIHQLCESTPIVLGYEFDASMNIRKYVDTEFSECKEGFVNAQNQAGDLRRVPILARDTRENPHLSLSYQAALSFDPMLSESPIVHSLLGSDHAAFAALVREHDIPKPYLIPSSDLVDSSTNKSNLQSLKDRVNNRIMLIGFPDDTVSTTEGPTHGYLLQMCYIEAFTSRRLIRELPWIADKVVALTFWSVIAFVGSGTLARTALRGSVALLAGLSLMFVLDTILVQFCGRYSDFALVSVLGVMIWVLQLLHALLDRRHQAAALTRP